MHSKICWTYILHPYVKLNKFEISLNIRLQSFPQEARLWAEVHSILESFQKEPQEQKISFLTGNVWIIDIIYCNSIHFVHILSLVAVAWWSGSICLSVETSLTLYFVWIISKITHSSHNHCYTDLTYFGLLRMLDMAYLTSSPIYLEN